MARYKVRGRIDVMFMVEVEAEDAAHANRLAEQVIGDNCDVTLYECEGRVEVEFINADHATLIRSEAQAR